MAKKIWLRTVVMGMMVALVSPVFGAENEVMRINTPTVIEVSLQQADQRFTVQVESNNTGPPAEGVWVYAEFSDGSPLQGGWADKKGRIYLSVPYKKREQSVDVTLWLPNYLNSKQKMVTLRYVNHLRYFGFTHTASCDVGRGNYLDEVTSFSNLALIQGETAEETAEKIRQASANGMLAIVGVDKVFFENLAPERGEIKLFPDYWQRWQEFAQRISAVKGGVIGFFPIDEPYWRGTMCGMPFRDIRLMLEEVTFQIKKTFPDKKVVGSIALTEVEINQGYFAGKDLPEDATAEYRIPYDWIAVYFYWIGFSGTEEEFVQTWQGRLASFEKNTRLWQKYILIPGTFYFEGLLQNKSLNLLEDELLKWGEAYYRLAQSNPKFVAIMPFLWEDTGNLRGVKHFPNLLKRWERIGEEIIQ